MPLKTQFQYDSNGGIKIISVKSDGEKKKLEKK